MKKSQAYAEIRALKGAQPLSKIIDIIKSIDNFRLDTLEKLNTAEPYSDSQDTIAIRELWVDLTYQRDLKLQKLINNLKNLGGFNKDVAGHIDIAERSDGNSYVWDGFHRAIKAAMVNLQGIPASRFKHDRTLTEQEEIQKEARMFKIRNADSTRMAPEEIFKSEVVFKDPEAMAILDLLKKCKLDVLGTNPDSNARSLGGFALMRKSWNTITARYFIDASSIIQIAWPADTNVSVILLCGMAKLLEANDEAEVEPLSVTSLILAIKKFVEDSDYNQTQFTQPRLHGKAIESTATNIIKLALAKEYNNAGEEVKTLIKYMDIDEDELYT